MSKMVSQIWTCETFVPHTTIRYRPHVLLIVSILLILAIFYPVSSEFTRCDDSVSYLNRHCGYSNLENLDEKEKCLQLNIDELGRCCDIKTNCVTDEPSRVHALECKFEQCYFGVYRPPIAPRTVIMLCVVAFGSVLVFSCRPEKR